MIQRTVDHEAMPVSGYTVPWTARAGGQIRLHLSSPFDIESVTIRRIDLPSARNMAWPVEKIDDVSSRSLAQGSFLYIGAHAEAGPVNMVRFELLLTANDGLRVILKAGRVELCLRDGIVCARVAGRCVYEGRKVPENVWLEINLENKEGGIAFTIRSADQMHPFALDTVLQGCSLDLADERIVFGTDPDGDGLRSLNARYGRISIATGTELHNWRFPTIVPVGPIPSDARSPLDLQVVNLPTFCVRSARWDGSSFDPRLVPDHYDAVHCHEDDTGPLDWPASHVAQVPPDCEAGIYAFDVETGEGAESVVFFVTSSKRRSPLVFLVPTATYLAYADEALPPHLYEWKCDDRGHRFANANGLLSLYDYHRDLSGVSICSWRKPKATLREDYRYPLCGCPHNLPVDLRLLRFCRAEGIEIDVITDHHLHENGVAALEGYRGLVTGSHPEYMSVEMEQAIRSFAAQGGGVAYLGGNGFAAVVAFRDDLMELRRSPLEAGRTWDGPVAEQALALTNEPGGMLRSRGRGEFSLVGVGISLMGFDKGRPFVRTGESRAAEVAWVFEGVSGEEFGDYGSVLGSAAGYEVDATDPHLGTHPDTVVLARATGFGDSFFHDPSRWYHGGEPAMQDRRCAEMVIRHLPSGSIVFAASSVAWCGALPEAGEMNDVGRITLNVLQRLSEAPTGTEKMEIGRNP